MRVFGSPAQRNLEPDTPREAAYERAAEIFRRALPPLAARGVKICMEPLTPKETNFVNTCAEALELMERVDEPNFCLHQDVKAMLGAETDPLPVVIDRFKQYTGHFHVNDSNLLGPGMGETDYVPIMEALLASGYSGWVSVEVFDYSPGPEVIARESLSNLKSALQAARERLS